MTSGAERRFSRLRDDSGDPASYSPLPDDGMCLSAYLLLSPEGDPSRVLLGRPDPSGPWAAIGAMGRRRVEAIDAWMLPSCHLMLFEGPREAAGRIAREQLGLERVALHGPEVFSEAYHRGGARRDPHWDLQFLFRGTLGPTPPSAPAWTELAFIDARALPETAFARGQGDILRLAGLRRARGTS